MLFQRNIRNFDLMLFLLVLAVCAFGIVAIGSATRINWGAETGEFQSQIKFFIMGIFIMAAVTTIDYSYMEKFYLVAYIANIALLLAVLFVGKSTKGAQRWIEIFGFRLQPSEFSKIVMIFCNAKIMAIYEERLNKLPILMLVALFGLAPMLLILVQPSLSSSLVILVIFLSQIFIAGLHISYIITALSVLVPSAVLFFLDIKREGSLVIQFFSTAFDGKFAYQINRVLGNINLDDEELSRGINYQIEKSITAIGSGQFSGKGLYNGALNRVSDIPEQHNDFIFSVIAEEVGFMGSVALLAVMLLIIFRCIITAQKACDTFGKLICAGVAGMLIFQTFVNVGVATAILPTTGMAFPFVSYGGSALWTNMIAIALVLNVGLKTPKSLFEGGKDEYSINCS